MKHNINALSFVIKGVKIFLKIKKIIGFKQEVKL
jgi:hypothetical protein